MKLSVWLICYNQENYIRQAVQSALDQKTNFNFEIVIGDDNSQDRTRDILRDLKKKYPKKIRLLLNKKNLGMVKNQVNVLNACKGKYIAMLEGDDYWLSGDKLQTQVDFLESNPEFSITSHNVMLKDEISGKFIGEWLGPKERDIDLRNLLRYGSGGATCSLVFLRKSLAPLPKWFANQPSSDWITQILCAKKGKMHYFSEAMAVYRRNTGGATTFEKGSSKELQAFTRGGEDYCLFLNSLFKFKYDREINQNLVTYFYPQIINAYLNKKDKRGAMKYQLKMIYGTIKYRIFSRNLYKYIPRILN